MSPAMTLLASAMAKDTNETPVDMAAYGLIDQSEGFYAYPGSLTTPTCNPVVTWIVMNHISSIPSSVLDHFQDKTADAEGHKAEFGNYRNLMSKGDRPVYFSAGDAGASYKFKGRACNPHGARQPVFACSCTANTTKGYPESAAPGRAVASSAMLVLMPFMAFFMSTVALF